MDARLGHSFWRGEATLKILANLLARIFRHLGALLVCPACLSWGLGRLVGSGCRVAGSSYG